MRGSSAGAGFCYAERLVSAAQKSTQPEPPAAPPAVWLPALGLGVALAASLALSAQHLGGLALPGCGLESACERATRSAWGRVPGVGWPLAHVGSAFFVALLAAWLASAGRLAAWLRVAVGLGAALSLLLVGVMLWDPPVCPWCLTVHAANLAFVACVWRGRRLVGAARSTLGFGLGLTLAALALAGFEWRAEDAVEGELRDSLARMQAGGSAPGFRGRWPLGPKLAPVRIVIFTDYQCPDCRAIEAQVEEVLRRWPEVSVSVKHFPFCSDCNRRLAERASNPHPGACRAAHAAEAAGLLGGAPGFWRMHRWLFARGGEFNTAELEAALPGLEFDVGEFRALLSSPSVSASVEADIEEGIALGLYVTPMIFLNGEELRGWNADRALVRAVESLLAQAPPARTANEDLPPSGLERLVSEWRAARPVRLPRTPDDRWLLGQEREDAVEVVLWGDYLDPPTRELDARIRAFAANEPRVRYAFRLFPLEAACNAAAETRYPGACAAALASAESLFEGRAAHLALHAQLMSGAVFGAGSNLARGREALRVDLADARRVRLSAVPLCFVAGRAVKRWRLEDEPVIEHILAEALEQ